jgi:hypothetical protein
MKILIADEIRENQTYEDIVKLCDEFDGGIVIYKSEYYLKTFYGGEEHQKLVSQVDYVIEFEE